MSYSSEVLADSPAVFWRQNDVPSGASSSVSGGQALTGSYSAQVTGPLTGSNGVSFAGSHVLYSNVNIAHSQFTVEAWIKTTMTGAATIVSNRGRAGAGKSLSIGIGAGPAGGGGAGRLWLGLDSNSLIIGIATNAAFNDGNWHHVAGVWNGSSGTTFATGQLTIYVDGSAAASSALTPFGTASAAPLVGADGYIFGATTSGPTSFYTGSLSRPALYGSALSSTRVAAHFAASTVSGYDAAVAADSPLAYWPLDTTPSAGTIADSSGNSRPASYTFQPTFDTAGGPKDKDARWPASTGVYASTAAAVNLSTGSGFTLETWVYLAATPSGKVTLVGNGAAAVDNTNTEVALYLDASGKPGFYLYTGSFIDLVAPSALSLNTWHHVVARAGSGGMQILVDNSVVATNALTPLTGYNRVLWLHAGGISSTGQVVRTAETALYNSVLSDARVSVHYTANDGLTAAGTASLGLSASQSAGATASGTASFSLSASGATAAAAAGSASLSLSGTGGTGTSQAASGSGSLTLSGSGRAIGTYVSEVTADSPLFWGRMGDASGTTLADSSGNARNGTYTGSPTFGASRVAVGTTDTAVAFDGSTQYGTVADAAWMDLSTLSVEAWCKPDAGVTGTQYVVARAGNLFWLGVDVSTGEVKWGLNGTASSTGAGITAGTAYHLALTYDGATVRVYRNGTEIANVAKTGAVSGTADIGIATFPGLTTNRFKGTVDEVAVYGTALSAARVQAHYTAGSTPAGSGSGAGSAVLTFSATGGGGSTGSDGATGALVLSATGGATMSAAATALLQLGVLSAEAYATYETDLSNAFDGLDLLLSATVEYGTVIASAPPGLAEHFDVAIPYPVPVMVNGRPT